MCFLKDRGMPCFGGRRSKKKRSMHQHAVSCQCYKKGCCSLCLIQPGKLAAIFSRKYTVCGASSDVNTVGFGLEERGGEKERERKEETTEDACRKNAKSTILQTECVHVCLYQPFSLHASVCVGGFSAIPPFRRVERKYQRYPQP